MRRSRLLVDDEHRHGRRIGGSTTPTSRAGRGDPNVARLPMSWVLRHGQSEGDQVDASPTPSDGGSGTPPGVCSSSPSDRSGVLSG